MLSYGQLPCVRGANGGRIRTTLGGGIRVPEPFDARHQKTGNSSASAGPASPMVLSLCKEVPCQRLITPW